MSEVKAVKRKTFKSSAMMNKVMADYFLELDHCSRTGVKKVAWCTSVGPAELLHSLGYVVHYPENHGAMLLQIFPAFRNGEEFTRLKFLRLIREYAI